MSDSTEDRRHRGRRGSLLDHARDAEPVSARETAEANSHPGPASARPASSLLTPSQRSARISTSRFAETPTPASPARSLHASAADAPAAPVAVESAAQAPVRPTSREQQKFGDRISRLIGTIAWEEKAEPQQPAIEPVEPARLSEAEPERSRTDGSAQSSAESDQSSYPDDRSHDARYRRQDQQPRGDNYPRDDHYHWHAATGGGQFEDGSRPLLDASILISSVWRFRRLIGAATVAGAVLGVLLALSTPHTFYAESRLFIDPREIRVTEDDIRNQQLSTEAMLAITDSQLQILSSTSVLEKVIADLGLDRDPEFNGSLSPGGISGGLSVIKEIFTGKNAASEGEQKALNNLRHSLSVGRDAKTFVIIVGVDTRDAEKSALIANQIVETYLDSEGQAQSSLLERTSESIDTRLNSLRDDLDKAEREVERFKAENGLVGVGGEYIDDKVILALSDQLANARAMKVGIRVKADNLARVKIDEVLSGAFPEELLSSNLSELRKQYTQTRSNAESLATRLGPRHPQYIAAMQSLETITKEISAELRRIVASSQTELQRAVETEQELASQMAVAKSRAIDQSVELVTLRELERKATATRGIYEAFLTRSRETSERSNMSTRNVRVISPAEAPLQSNGPSRKFIAIGGMIAGFLGGLGLALLAGAIESIRVYNNAQPKGRFQNPPYGGYPEPTSPGPATPPGGPGHRFWPRGNEDASDRGPSAAGASAKPYSAARARSGQDQAGRPTPVQAEPVAAHSGQFATTEDDAATPFGAHPNPAPQASSYDQPEPAADSNPAIGRNAQAFMAAHGQSQYHAPAQPPVAAFAPGQDPRGGQPLWAAYPAQPSPTPQAQQYQPIHPGQPLHHSPYQHQLLPMYPTHPGYVTDPYAQGHPAYSSGYPAGAPVSSYPAPQPQMMPVQPHQAPQQAYHPMYPPAPQPRPESAPIQYASAPGYMPQANPTPVQVSPTSATEATRPVRNETVDRIRREMDDLRSRIDGYGSDRRRA